MGRSPSSSVVYCSVWVNSANYSSSGKGSAGGGGYHKESAALQAALTSAGIELRGDPYKIKAGDFEGRPCSIGGCGEDAMRKAPYAIGLALKADMSNFLII
jgi:hypothetical protein